METHAISESSLPNIRYKINIIQVYAPIADYEDEYIKSLKTDKNQTHHYLVVEDPNAIAERKRRKHNSIANYGIGRIIEREQMLVNFKLKVQMSKYLLLCFST